MPPTNPAPASRNAKPEKTAVTADPKLRKPGAAPLADDEPREKLVPPPETFWTRYSPNGEAVISPAASVVLHALALGFIMFGVLSLFDSKQEVEEIEPVLIGDGGPGGGGGNILGEENNNPGMLSKNDVSEDLNKQDPVETKTPEDEKVAAPKDAKLEDDPLTEKIKETKKRDPNAGIFIKDALKGVAGKGRGGSGSGGGLGSGIGKGVGDKWGTGPTSKRGQRALRWEMLFRTNDNADYLRQLNNLGAYIGVPDQNGKLMVIKNLNERPARPVYEDMVSVNRVFWVDSRPDSARGIAELLQLNVIPQQFVAFIPISIEDQLLKVEMEYAKKYGVTEESKIKSTQFTVSYRGGKPVFAVKNQERR